MHSYTANGIACLQLLQTQQGAEQTFVDDSRWARLVTNVRVSIHIHISEITNSSKERGKKNPSSNDFNVHICSLGSFLFELLAVNIDTIGIIIVRFE